MKVRGKSVFFIVAAIVIIFAMMSLFGIDYVFGDRRDLYVKSAADIRWGIDIRGGVDATFSPPPEQENVTQENMGAAEELIKQRLVNLGITDNEVYTDFNKHRIIVRFPWKSDEADFDPEAAIKELGETAMLTFREGHEYEQVDEISIKPSGVTEENIILTGEDVDNASPGYDNSQDEFVVNLRLKGEGTRKFAEATGKLSAAEPKGTISIWMDDAMISYPSVNAHITDGNAVISGGFTQTEVQSLANKINSGSLPFKLETTSYNTIPSTLGSNALSAMMLAGIITYVFIAVFMVLMYRLPGAVSAITVLGHVTGSLAAISGFLFVFPSFTLTLPGIAGIILGLGMGVDANVLIFSRINEELGNGKSLRGAVDIGYKRGFTAVIDGNITVVIVAIILMGAFGPPDGTFAKLLNPVFFMFGPSTAGAIYSFGYTLVIGVIMNFIFSILASRLMLKSLIKFKVFQNLKFFRGIKKEGA
ncbi:MAG: MMPL family transporter [Oscillospiraceae bacterium]|nr:MMPL family transporter [Oscillospiraceae bacterium]